MMTAYQVFFANGSVLHGSVLWPEMPAADEVSALVAPLLDRPMHHLAVVYGGVVRDMFVGDRRRERMYLRTGAGLGELNEAATAIYREAILSKFPGENEDDLPNIVGPAVLFDRLVWP
jgi:hypothetical protein